MSITYTILNRFGARLSPELKDVGAVTVIRRALQFWMRDILLAVARTVPFGPLGSRWIRPRIFRWMGVKVGKRVHIAPDVFIDPVHAHLVTIEDGAGIAPRTTIFAHQRNLNHYRQGMWIADCPYYVAPVVIGKGASIGTGCIILPGVTIGQGAIIAAGTLVNKNIPAYSLAAGFPAKVLKTFAAADA